MSSRYEGMTAAELVRDAMMHGFSTTQEDICAAQDVFGHTAIEELDRLANDNGRNDENGQPDPKGSWSSNRRPTVGQFYSILFQIWNWEDATRFWNQHSNPEREELLSLRKQVESLKTRASHAEEQAVLEHNNRLDETNGRLKAEEDARRLAAELHDRDMQIMELKAKLYDMMMKEGQK